MIYIPLSLMNHQQYIFKRLCGNSPPVSTMQQYYFPINLLLGRVRHTENARSITTRTKAIGHQTLPFGKGEDHLHGCMENIALCSTRQTLPS